MSLLARRASRKPERLAVLLSTRSAHLVFAALDQTSAVLARTFAALPTGARASGEGATKCVV